MKIYFCDICNQSIPLKDLDDGAAVPVRGKLICNACSAAAATGKAPQSGMPAAPVAAAVQGGGGGSAGASLIVILIAGGLGFGASWFMLKEETKKIDAKFASMTGDTGRIGTDSDRKIQALRDEIAQVQQSIELLKTSMDENVSVSEARERKAAADVETRFENVKAYITENEKVKDRVQNLEMRLTAGNESALGVQKEIATLRGAVVELTDRVAKMIANPPARNDANPGATEDGNVTNSDALPVVALPNDLAEIAKKLKHTDAGVRWDGVDQLGRSRDTRVVGYLVPMLDDKDEFVRYQTAAVLGDLGQNAKSSVPFLIMALSDEAAYVRESVIFALRKITNQNIKFEPTAKSEDRTKQQKLWKAWWDTNREKFLQG
ncbi:MAG: HEAT repeat domain-containing protein [Planctomycetota bacterium]